jgi:hypothetical protein
MQGVEGEVICQVESACVWDKTLPLGLDQTLPPNIDDDEQGAECLLVVFEEEGRKFASEKVLNIQSSV